MNQIQYTGWRKSSYSGSSGNCVEITAADHRIAVRDTKQDGRGPILEFTSAAWRKFIAETKGKISRTSAGANSVTRV